MLFNQFNGYDIGFYVYAASVAASVAACSAAQFVAVCQYGLPYWLIRLQEYKFEINGPWDEAKLCFDITD